MLYVQLREPGILTLVNPRCLFLYGLSMFWIQYVFEQLMG
jgi:hypothetical protein